MSPLICHPSFAPISLKSSWKAAVRTTEQSDAFRYLSDGNVEGGGKVEFLRRRWRMRDGVWRQAARQLDFDLAEYSSLRRAPWRWWKAGYSSVSIWVSVYSEISCCWLTVLGRSLFVYAAGSWPDVQRRRARPLTHPFESQKGNLRINPVGKEAKTYVKELWGYVFKQWQGSGRWLFSPRLMGKLRKEWWPIFLKKCNHQNVLI